MNKFLNVNIGLPLEDKELAAEIMAELDDLGVYFETETFEKEGIYNINAGFDSAEEGTSFADKWEPLVYVETESFDLDETEPITRSRSSEEVSDILESDQILESDGEDETFTFDDVIDYAIDLIATGDYDEQAAAEEAASKYNFVVEDILTELDIIL